MGRFTSGLFLLGTNKTCTLIHCWGGLDIILPAAAGRDSQLPFCFRDLGGCFGIADMQCCCSSFFSKLPYAEGEESRCCCAAYVGFMPAWEPSVLQKSSAVCSRQLEVPLTWRWLPSIWPPGWRATDVPCCLQRGLIFSLDTYRWRSVAWILWLYSCPVTLILCSLFMLPK